MIKLILPLTAIGAITCLELFAISKGIDGIIFNASIAAIAGLGGYTAKPVKEKLSGVIAAWKTKTKLQ